MSVLVLASLLAVLATVGTALSNNLDDYSGLRPERRKSLDFNHFRQLLQEDNGSYFENEARCFREDGLPDLEDLTSMANELFSGKVPQYLTKNNYTIYGSFEGDFAIEDGASYPDQRGASYFNFNKDEDRGTFSMLDFYNVTGTIGNYSFVSGSIFHTYARYVKGETSVDFEVSTLGAILFRLPSGIFSLSGNYTGVSQGRATLTTADVTEASVNTLGILNAYQYSSRNVMCQHGRYSPEISRQRVNSVSLTGGTNFTLNTYVDLKSNLTNPQMYMNGTLHNHDKDSALSVYLRGSNSPLVDVTDPFNEVSLAGIISLSRQGAEVYLA